MELNNEYWKEEFNVINYYTSLVLLCVGCRVGGWKQFYNKNLKPSKVGDEKLNERFY